MLGKTISANEFSYKGIGLLNALCFYIFLCNVYHCVYCIKLYNTASWIRQFLYNFLYAFDFLTLIETRYELPDTSNTVKPWFQAPLSFSLLHKFQHHHRPHDWWLPTHYTFKWIIMASRSISSSQTTIFRSLFESFCFIRVSSDKC